jgi:hypothetical protein
MRDFVGFATKISDIVGMLRGLSLFPGRYAEIPGWKPRFNNNPMVGFAIKIENNGAQVFSWQSLGRLYCRFLGNCCG